MKKVVVIPNTKKDVDLGVTKKVISKLIENGLAVYVDEAFLNISADVNCFRSFPDDADLIIVVGGDGTILDASVFALMKDIPILGINLGKVGYLSEVEPEDLSLLDRLFKGDYTIEEKMVLETSLDLDGTVGVQKYAVNDIVVSHDSYLGIADIRLEDGWGNSIKYRSDGIILASPQGSTAYSLSAGGPVVAHGLDCIIVTPVCPHSFFNRSVIFDSSEVLRVTNINADDLNISLDGRCFTKLKTGESCIVKMANKRLKMLSFAKNKIFKNLFGKMKMLEDN